MLGFARRVKPEAGILVRQPRHGMCSHDRTMNMNRESLAHAGPAKSTRSPVPFVGKGKALPHGAALALRKLGSLVEREGPLPPERTVPLVREAARSLAAAPSPARGASARSDVQSLGAALFFALTGLPPASGMPRSPSVLSPHPVPSALDAVVRMCLAKQRSDQFCSVLEVAAALSAFSFKMPGALLG
jgi:hypothetical protein